MVCNFSLTPAHALGEYGTPTDAGRRVQGAAVWCVAVQKQRYCGRLWANFGRKRYTEGHAAHAASARWFFPTLLGVCGIFCAYQLRPCLLDPRPPCQRAACQVRPPIWASRGTGQTDGARRGTARCEVMEGCWKVPPKIVRAHIAACGRGRVSKTRASSRLARILAGDGTRKSSVFVFFAKIRPAGAHRGVGVVEGKCGQARTSRLCRRRRP